MVVETVDVVGHFATELDSGDLFPQVQKFGLHSRPGRLDQGVVAAITNRAKVHP